MYESLSEVLEQMYREICESELPSVDFLSHEIVQHFYLESLTDVTIEQIFVQQKYDMDVEIAVQNKTFISHVTEDWLGLFVETFEHILDFHYFVREENHFKNFPIRKVW